MVQNRHFLRAQARGLLALILVLCMSLRARYHNTGHLQGFLSFTGSRITTLSSFLFAYARINGLIFFTYFYLSKERIKHLNVQ